MGYCAVQGALCLVAAVLNVKVLFIDNLLSHGCTLYTEYTVQCIVYSIHCKDYIVEFMVYSLQCIV